MALVDVWSTTVGHNVQVNVLKTRDYEIEDVDKAWGLPLPCTTTKYDGKFMRLNSE